MEREGVPLNDRYPRVTRIVSSADGSMLAASGAKDDRIRRATPPWSVGPTCLNT